MRKSKKKKGMQPVREQQRLKLKRLKDNATKSATSLCATGGRMLDNTQNPRRVKAYKHQEKIDAVRTQSVIATRFIPEWLTPKTPKCEGLNFKDLGTR